MCCQASYMRCSHYRSVADLEAAWWTSVNLTTVSRPDCDQDGRRFDSGDAFFTIGSQRTTKVKRELNAKVPHVVAQEPPPR